jgi:hypothetical protein
MSSEHGIKGGCSTRGVHEGKAMCCSTFFVVSSGERCKNLLMICYSVGQNCLPQQSVYQWMSVKVVKPVLILRGQDVSSVPQMIKWNTLETIS